MKYLLIMVLLVGCSTTGKMRNLSVGMTKDQVIKELGRPYEYKANQDAEVLVYNLYNADWHQSEYWITLKKGQVVEYGRAPEEKKKE